MTALQPALLDAFTRANPQLLAARSLQRRTDTKFVVPARRLERVIVSVRGDYALLPAGAALVQEYRTVYFDTPDLMCFHDHRRGRRPRHKVRIRHYPDRGVSFLETKTKQSEMLTRKHRAERPFGDGELTAADRAFIGAHTRLPVAHLEPRAHTDFRRLTLLGIRTQERVTVDIDLCVGATGGDQYLDGVAIVEVKQSPYCARTPIMEALRDAGHRPTSASKYCAAAILSGQADRYNRLRPTLRALERCAA